MANRKSAKRRPRKPLARRRSVVGWLVNWGGTLAIWGVIAVAGLVTYYGYDLPDISRLEEGLKRAPRITLVSRGGVELASFGGLYGTPVALTELPPYLAQAVVATEDRRFYRHFGVDMIGLARAMYSNLRAGRVVQGGSTITQQLAKNLWLTPERTIRRKVQELLLALWLEQRFGKDRILSMYLNRVYLGAGTYGVEAAAQRYFGKSARRVSLAEAAMLAGLLKAPTRYAPTNDLKRAQGRASVVLDKMVEAGFIDEAQAAAARRRPARLAGFSRRARNTGYFTDWIVERIASYVGPTDRDLVVVTTLDLRFQLAAEQVVEKALEKEGKRSRVGQGALLAMGPDGSVRAMVGGRSYAASQYNRAVVARRQPGSAFKLFVYLAGLEAGFRPDDTWRDQPIDVNGWKPRNYGGKYRGVVTMREALSRSINTVAVAVSEKAGRGRVIEAARRLGIESPLPPNPSLALGTAEVTLLELVSAYATLPNGGRGVIPHGIVEIRDAGGATIYRRSGGGPGQVIDPANVAMLNDMLGTVMTSGTGKAARLDRPAAGKTGTSQDSRDAWFIGYTPELVAGVWFGNDDASPMRRVTGGGLPARTWKAFMTRVLAGVPVARLETEAPSPVAIETRSLWQKILETFGGGVKSRDGGNGGGIADSPDSRGTYP